MKLRFKRFPRDKEEHCKLGFSKHKSGSMTQLVEEMLFINIINKCKIMLWRLPTHPLKPFNYSKSGREFNVLNVGTKPSGIPARHFVKCEKIATWVR